ncbi:glycosyltransferase [Thiomicrorhabdus sp. ZW0627]|uniref:glycosyltransferase n=1 Tax=Thiomicrorhabdus sp. ZW0627 TaxID=3039774 RepID=UPI0024368AC7|nr:glycosyltransferase [Thiomicrorhabdus sp. ZW0627]MDG6772819.1 glycosyltransferase [Thiomicrorhabdus sp. ZW0627]
MKRKLLIIGYVWPEPKSSAAGTRMMQLIELFQRHDWQITFASPAALGEHREDLNTLGIDEQPIELNSASFDVFVSQLQPDTVVFDRFMMEEQFGWRVEKHCPNALRILNTEDLHSLREARQQRLKNLLKKENEDLSPLWDNTAETLFDIMADNDLTQREVASIFRSDLTLMISEFETRLLQQAFQVSPSLLFTLPFLYDSDRLPEMPDDTQRQHFVFIGNFRHAPNWDAVLWLKTAIWPKIRQALPQAELHVYGAYPAKKVTDLNNPKQGFLVKGWAEDALLVLSQARVCLAPLRFGAGIKGKLAEAMLCGTPSITTPIGAEAMLPQDASRSDWPGLIATDEDAIAEAAIELYQNQTLWQKAQSKGKSLAKERYCNAQQGEALIERIEEILAALERHRKQNFIGSMLRHHQHKSTQYMAQWIEAKNRKPE